MCWCEALKLANAAHPGRHSAVRVVLLRDLVYTGSSCGVEQNYSTAQWMFDGRRMLASDECFADEMKIVCDQTEQDDDVLITGAIDVWRYLYGSARSSPKLHRSDQGIACGPRTPAGGAEIDFLRARRRAARAAAPADHDLLTTARAK